MTNIINPYSSSRTPLQGSTKSKSEAEEELHPVESTKADSVKLAGNSLDINAARTDSTDKADISQLHSTSKVQDIDAPSSTPFDNTLAGAVENTEEVSHQNAVNTHIPGLSTDEQRMIYRYFPESPNLEVRIYKQDMSTNKVTPGSVGSRVDIRG